MRSVIAPVSLVGIAAALAMTSAFSTGCLSRDVASDAPTVKTNFGVDVQQTAVDKVDILFMIDNSTSMGDKQFLLEQAVPLLVQRLVTPNCVDAKGNANGSVAKSDGTCATGSPEFAAVHDMHIGIVSSSIGDFGVSSPGANQNAQNGLVCPATTYPTQNDHAHLLNRTAPQAGVATPDAPAPGNFLAWFPNNSSNAGKTAPAKPITSAATLESDFTALVGGVQQFGCGLEGQLESWYQFLIQPDPWVSIAVSGGKATRVGVDTTTLRQRHDFLRPDSLVAVIGLSDEDDSTVDPGAFGGQSWIFERNVPAPLPTPACANNPNDPTCTSCALDTSATGCSSGGNPSTYAATAGQPTGDPLNVRFTHMKQRYGIDPQYPVSRYVDGLTTTTVPNRNGETHQNNLYHPTANCTNPLFASSLPDGSGLSGTIATAPTSDDLDKLCSLPVGSRSSQLVFFGFIGGVPWQLLTTNPKTATATSSDTFVDPSTLSDAAQTAFWQAIIGKSPETYDYTGQDVHMQVSTAPRTGIPTSGNTADPYNGSDYDTGGYDLEYACTFDLPPKTTGGTVGTDCSAAAIMADTAAGASSPYDGLLGSICDCETPLPFGGPRPLCGDGTSAPATTQIRGKAYPTIREFSVVHDMGKNGIIASLCPRNLNVPTTDPNYGYNPAVNAIISRLKTQLANVCPPRALTVAADGTVPCQVVEVLQTGTCAAAGLTDATGSVLTSFLQQEAASGPNGDAGVGGSAICVLNPVGHDCSSDTTPDFCYVTAAEAPTDPSVVACGGVLKFSPTGLPSGAVAHLECLETSGGDTAVTGDDDSGAATTNAGD